MLLFDYDFGRELVEGVTGFDTGLIWGLQHDISYSSMTYNYLGSRA